MTKISCWLVVQESNYNQLLAGGTGGTPPLNYTVVSLSKPPFVLHDLWKLELVYGGDPFWGDYCLNN